MRAVTTVIVGSVIAVACSSSSNTSSPTTSSTTRTRTPSTVQLQNRLVLSELPASISYRGKTCTTLVPAKPPADQAAGWFWDKPDPTTKRHTSCFQLGPDLLSQQHVKTATAEYDAEQREWSVDVTYRGTSFADAIGSKYAHQQIAIVLDGQVLSAPFVCGTPSASTCNSLPGPTVTISGGFTKTSAQSLAAELRAN